MDFGFSEQQADVQALARKILSEQVTPEKLASLDEFKSERFDRELWQQLAEAGLLGVAVEEAYGGMGFGYTELALFVEELGRSIAPVPAIPALVSAALPIQRFGTAQQKEQWLPGVANGSTLLSAALMEPIGERPENPVQTTATAEGDGYRLNGVKTCVPFAQSADRILLAARYEVGVIVVLLDPASAGVSVQELQYTTYEPQYEVRLDNVLVAAADVLAEPVEGAEVMAWLTQRTTTALCAHQLGVSDQSMRMTASYTSERKQFGVEIRSITDPYCSIA